MGQDGWLSDLDDYIYVFELIFAHNVVFVQGYTF